MVGADEKRPRGELGSRRCSCSGDVLRRAVCAACCCTSFKSQRVNSPWLQTAKQETPRKPAELQVPLTVQVIHLDGWERRLCRRDLKEIGQAKLLTSCYVCV